MVVTFTSRLSAAATPLKHAWEHTVGSCHALLALRADWQDRVEMNTYLGALRRQRVPLEEA
jgi:xylan 1,4-beta-xylosidase